MSSHSIPVLYVPFPPHLQSYSISILIRNRCPILLLDARRWSIMFRFVSWGEIYVGKCQCNLECEREKGKVLIIIFREKLLSLAWPLGNHRHGGRCATDPALLPAVRCVSSTSWLGHFPLSRQGDKDWYFKFCALRIDWLLSEPGLTSFCFVCWFCFVLRQCLTL